jgi:hypothetical protein
MMETSSHQKKPNLYSAESIINILLGNCDIDFFIFRHRRVQNLKILSWSKCDRNYSEDFRNYRKRKQKLTKFNKIGQNQSFIW